MRIYRSLEEAAGRFGPCALTIGNFDGVHAAHRRILRRVKAVADDLGLAPAALTFDPHPTRIVAPERAPRLMTTPGERCALMAREGIGAALVLEFTRELSELSPQEFARRILADVLQARVVLVGDNFRFGHGQSGDVVTLAALGSPFDYAVEVVHAIRIRGQMVSSSAIRRLIEAGDVSRACRLLERPYALTGEVVSGRGVGSRQTVPTLNLATLAEVLPARGVYITRTHDLDDGRRWHSITNIGVRPTFGNSGELSIETFLLTPLEGETPRRISLEFLRRVREEREFPNPAELRAQILKDVSRAQTYFRRLPTERPAPPVRS
jgi:riboflavin kinase/FMN adenylyltransferase